MHNIKMCCLYTAGECSWCLCATDAERKPRRRSEPGAGWPPLETGPRWRLAPAGDWPPLETGLRWRLASGTASVLSELYVLRIMSERSQRERRGQ